MRTVHKFELRHHSVTNLMLPVGARILRIDMQYGRICAWIALNTEMPYIEPYAFVIVGTGQAVPDGFGVHSTFFEDVGAPAAFVWHACLRKGNAPYQGEGHRKTLGEMELMNA
jgi:hypothetical protein